jgi:hypothetical protein
MQEDVEYRPSDGNAPSVSNKSPARSSIGPYMDYMLREHTKDIHEFEEGTNKIKILMSDNGYQRHCPF